MCRSIKVLRRADMPPSEQEIHEAALQFVRKISGYRVPSQKNAEPFEAAVREVSRSSRQLLQTLAKNSAPATTHKQQLHSHSPNRRAEDRERRNRHRDGADGERQGQAYGLAEDAAKHRAQ